MKPPSHRSKRGKRPIGVRLSRCKRATGSRTEKKCQRVPQEHPAVVRCSLMLPGHTKIAPDRLFSCISAKYRPADVFDVEGLRRIVASALDPGRIAVEEVKATHIKQWKAALDDRYREVAGIREDRWIRARKDDAGNIVLERKRTNVGDEGFLQTVMPTGEPLLPVTGIAKPGVPKKIKDLHNVYLKYIEREHWPQCVREYSS